MRTLKIENITTKDYLTRSILNKIFMKELSIDDIDNLILGGSLKRHHSYYKITEQFLRNQNVIPERVTISDESFNRLAKKSFFTLTEIGNIFDAKTKDITKIIADRYFQKRSNYWYKTEELSELLSEGIFEFEL